MRKLIRVDGTTQEFPTPLDINQITSLIGAPEALDTIWLRHMGEPRHVMMIDDTGLVDERAENPEATRLYHLNCKPGTTAAIHGDVMIVPDNDFAD